MLTKIIFIKFYKIILANFGAKTIQYFILKSNLS